MARWQIHMEAVAEIDTKKIREELGEDIAQDARDTVVRDTGRTAEHIHVEVDGDSVIVVADAARTQKQGEEHYDYWVEKGARGIPPKPFLRPAAYKYRG